MSKAKIFVLDTNVLLHDYKAIHNFQDNDLVIPVAVVEEVDKFKKGNDALAYNAR
ncbi:MAG TPA: PIN domain-containing protein, partial [Candidatus Cryptobacteroides sp.]|nr:PIN domain-containing protein [Candidatus Cryptobacteroides sp.]